MTVISKQQAYKRWDTLPGILLEALASETNSATVWRICENEHLPKEKIRIVARIAGHVLMGFIHPEDIAEELRGQLNINPQLAANIANVLNSRIFSGVRDELDKIYALPSEPIFAPAELPRIIEEVKKPTSSAGPAAPKPTIQQSAPTPAPPAPPPMKSPSTQLGASPSTQLGASRVEPPVVSPSTQLGASRAEPVFIHKEAVAKPITPKPGFHFEIPIPKPPAAPKPAAPEPAKIEVGPLLSGKPPSAAQPIKPPIGRTEVPIPRVIHYSQWKTSLEKPSGKPEPVPLSQLSAISVPKPPPATDRVEPPAVSPSTQLGASPSTQLGASPSTQLGASRVEPPMPKPPIPSAPPSVKPIGPAPQSEPPKPPAPKIN